MKNWKYCSNSWFIHSICSSVCRWNDVNSLVLIYNILFSSFINSAANCYSLSNTTLSGNLYNFHILFLNNYTNPSTNAPFVIVTKYVILDNLLQTTRITSFPTTNSNLVIKSTIKYVYNFSGILLNFNFPTSISIIFFIL